MLRVDPGVRLSVPMVRFVTVVGLPAVAQQQHMLQKNNPATSSVVVLNSEDSFCAFGLKQRTRRDGTWWHDRPRFSCTESSSFGHFSRRTCRAARRCPVRPACVAANVCRCMLELKDHVGCHQTRKHPEKSVQYSTGEYHARFGTSDLRLPEFLWAIDTPSSSGCWSRCG